MTTEYDRTHHLDEPEAQSRPDTESGMAAEPEIIDVEPVTESERTTGFDPHDDADSPARPKHGATQSAPSADLAAPLFGAADAESLRTQFRELQGTFVDDPHEAVTKADGLVTEIIQQLTVIVSERKQSLEDRWARDSHTDEDDTEDLRQALRGYRAFFNQLLNVGQ